MNELHALRARLAEIDACRQSCPDAHPAWCATHDWTAQEEVRALSRLATLERQALDAWIAGLPIDGTEKTRPQATLITAGSVRC